MQATLLTLIAWVKSNPYATLSIVVWLIANVVPRPSPKPDQNQFVRMFWNVIDRLCVLTSDGLPGKFKMLLTATPRPAGVAVTDKGSEPKIDGGVNNG